MAFGDKVRQLRKARRLTQSDLAKALSLSQRAISELESGKTQPKQDAIRRIAEILECSFEDLMTEDPVALPSVIDPVALEGFVIPLMGAVGLSRFEWPASLIPRQSLEVPKRIYGEKRFALQAGDDSMELEIQIDDYCIFEPGIKPLHGAIVCCEVAGPDSSICMVRTFLETEEAVILQPAKQNDPQLHTLIMVKQKGGRYQFEGKKFELDIKGVLVGLFRDYPVA
ncbi:MAG: helix-turn-helix domain-containing protein [Planctomycetota bacterium]|jgi:transcriptional regulator with XRE-family HTH domain|nr:helix-turn-helix domain-containing protein [Planctomycetota bacterium]MDP7250523.1 helix-turn-helix domain-containing protein [Planctomycetota bacterium]